MNDALAAQITDGPLIVVRGELAVGLIDDRGAGPDDALGLLAAVGSSSAEAIERCSAEAHGELTTFAVVWRDEAVWRGIVTGDAYVVLGSATGEAIEQARAGQLHSFESSDCTDLRLCSRSEPAPVDAVTEDFPSGVARASMVIALPGSAQAQGVAPQQPAEEHPPSTAPGVESQAAPFAPTQRIELVDLTPDSDQVVEPLPVAAVPTPSPHGASAQVLGIRCPVDHHNHPDALYCSQCGRRMGVNQTAVAQMGPRPPLGLLLIDDIATHPVKEDLVIGREPASQPELLAGRTALVLEDDEREMSRAHVEIRIDGWDVTARDLNSANGTLLQRSSTDAWHPLSSDEATVLGAGDVLKIGRREVQLELHHIQT